MARIRIVEKEATLIAENRGHALFMPWRRRKDDGDAIVSAECARCGEEIGVQVAGHHRKTPHVSGPVNCACAPQPGNGGRAA
jgi:hypothetical protein